MNQKQIIFGVLKIFECSRIIGTPKAKFRTCGSFIKLGHFRFCPYSDDFGRRYANLDNFTIFSGMPRYKLIFETVIGNDWKRL